MSVIELGTGFYSVPDAASILNLDTAHIRRWITRYWEMEFVQDGKESPYTEGSGRERVFNFYTLMELVAVSQLRTLGVSWHRIKKAHQIASSHWNTPYPFANKQIALMADRKQIFADTEINAVLQLDDHKQLVFKNLVTPYLKKVDYDNRNLAEKYWPIGKERAVVVDPKHRMGDPVLKGTNIGIDVLWNYLRAGEEKEFIANLYEIPVAYLDDVIRYYNRPAA